MLLLVKKFQKDNTRTVIDQIINDTIFPESQVDKPGRANRYNINISLAIYVASPQQANVPTSIQFHNPPQNIVKHNIRASYNIDKIDTFFNLENKKTKSANITNMDSDATHTTTSLSNEESLSREEFLQMLKKITIYLK